MRRGIGQLLFGEDGRFAPTTRFKALLRDILEVIARFIGEPRADPRHRHRPRRGQTRSIGFKQRPVRAPPRTHEFDRVRAAVRTRHFDVARTDVRKEIERALHVTGGRVERQPPQASCHRNRLA